MAQIHCPECKTQVAPTIESCPSCGYPIRAAVTAALRKKRGLPPAPMPTPVSAPVSAAPAQGWDPTVAALLSLVLPGSGQIYKGQVANGLVWFLCVLLGYFFFIFPGVVLHICCIIGAASGKKAR